MSGCVKALERLWTPAAFFMRLGWSVSGASASQLTACSSRRPSHSELTCIVTRLHGADALVLQAGMGQQSPFATALHAAHSWLMFKPELRHLAHHPARAGKRDTRHVTPHVCKRCLLPVLEECARVCRG